MIILALLGALIVGISLGLLGSGGSIFTVPILVILLHRPDKIAIAESLGIVGVIAFSGALYYSLRHQVVWKSVLYFGLSGTLGAYVGASSASYVSGSFQMTLFALTMFVVAGIMLFNLSPTSEEEPENEHRNSSIMITTLQGFLVGCMTGLIGCGGGFLIVPALVFLCRLNIRLAIGTSLAIITLNSFTGFIRQWYELHQMHLELDWTIIGIFSSFGIFGSLYGSKLSTQFSQQSLKKLFAISVVLLGGILLWYTYKPI